MLMTHLPPTQEYATYVWHQNSYRKEVTGIRVEMPLGSDIDIVARKDDPYVLAIGIQMRTNTVREVCLRDFVVKHCSSTWIAFEGANYDAIRWLIEDLRQLEQDHVDNVRGGALAVLGALRIRDKRNPLGQKLSPVTLLLPLQIEHTAGDSPGPLRP